MAQRALTEVVTVAASPLSELGVDPDSVVLSPERTALRFLGRGDVDHITKVLVLGGMPVLEVEAFQEVLGGFHDRLIDLEEDLRDHGVSKTRAPLVASRIVRSLIEGLQTLLRTPATLVPARQFGANETVAKSQGIDDGAAIGPADGLAPILLPEPPTITPMAPTPTQLSAARWWQSVLDNYLRSLGQTRIPAPRLLPPPASIPPPEVGDSVVIGGIEYQIEETGTNFDGNPHLILTAGEDIKIELNYREIAILRLAENDANHRTYLLPSSDPVPASGIPSSRAPVRNSSRRVDAQGLWAIIQSSEGGGIMRLLSMGELSSRALYDLLQALENPIRNGYASVASTLRSLAKKEGFTRRPPKDIMDVTHYGLPQEPSGRVRTWEREAA
jgi:hypothetical protein